VPERGQFFDLWKHILDYVKKKIEKIDRCGALAVGVIRATQTPRATQTKVTVSAIAKSRIITPIELLGAGGFSVLRAS
jgi:hypothetical protein